MIIRKIRNIRKKTNYKYNDNNKAIPSIFLWESICKFVFLEPIFKVPGGTSSQSKVPPKVWETVLCGTLLWELDSQRDFRQLKGKLCKVPEVPLGIGIPEQSPMEKCFPDFRWDFAPERNPRRDFENWF